MLRLSSGLYRDQAACSPACGFGASTSTVPPAFSTAAMADFDAPKTENATLALISPAPRSRMPSLTRRMTPALTSAAASILAAGSSVPASIAAWIRLRFTSFSLRANMLFLKPRFGTRRCRGIWPPSKPLMRTPERAVWPLPPRPPVLPVPEPLADLARSGRRGEFVKLHYNLHLVLPFQGKANSFLHHFDQMRDLGDHAAGRRRIGELGDAADLIEL